jgi:hypothetical protein
MEHLGNDRHPVWSTLLGGLGTRTPTPLIASSARAWARWEEQGGERGGDLHRWSGVSTYSLRGRADVTSSTAFHNVALTLGARRGIPYGEPGHVKGPLPDCGRHPSSPYADLGMLGTLETCFVQGHTIYTQLLLCVLSVCLHNTLGGVTHLECLAQREAFSFFGSLPLSNAETRTNPSALHPIHVL